MKKEEKMVRKSLLIQEMLLQDQLDSLIVV